MAEINWKEIIAYILRLIADGLDKQEAVKKATNRFGVSMNDIIKRI